MTTRISGLVRWLPRLLTTAVLAWCVGIGWQIWSTPFPFTGKRASVREDGSVHRQTVSETRSFSEISRLGATPLAVPVLIAGLAAWSAWKGRSAPTLLAALALLGFAFFTGFSIGGAYAPAGWALVAASAVLLATKRSKS